jgi:hypothetical protein
MTWREAHEEGMFAAAEAHDRLDIDTGQRIDVFKAIEDLGLALLFRPLRGLAGLCIPSSGHDQGGVLISAHLPLSRQRFTAAHELGHTWLGHRPSLDHEVELLRSPPDDLDSNEMVADAFAAWFLMPPELVDLQLDLLGVSPPLSSLEVYNLALHLGTSFTATAFHLVNLRLADLSAARSWAGTNLKSLKLNLSRGYPMPSYRQNVWHLTHSADVKALQVTSGDRIVVSRSSQVLWQIDQMPQDSSVTVVRTDGAVCDDMDFSGRTQGHALILDLSPDVAGLCTFRGAFEIPTGGVGSTFTILVNAELPTVGLRQEPPAPLKAVH